MLKSTKYNKHIQHTEYIHTINYVIKNKYVSSSPACKILYFLNKVFKFFYSYCMQFIFLKNKSAYFCFILYVFHV